MRNLCFVVVTMATMIVFGLHAKAMEMNCRIGVVTAQNFLDLKNSLIGFNDISDVVSVPLKGRSGMKQFTINGETVEVSLTRREHVDMYDTFIQLRTPVADIPPGPFRSNAMIDDPLYNDGPAENAGSTVFAYNARQDGTFAVTSKLRKVLEAKKMWGSTPFKFPEINVSYMMQVALAVEPLIRSRNIKPSDVVGLFTLKSCNLVN